MARTTYAALLPGINVSGHKRITMADLAACFREAGCDDVRTYVQSGNVVFTSGTSRRRLAGELTDAIRAGTGHDVAVLLRSVAELEHVVDGNPFGERADAPKALHVVFLDRPAAEALGDFDPAPFAPERLAVGRHELYLDLPNGIGRAKLPVALTRGTNRSGVVATARNWRSTTKILDLAREVQAGSASG